VCGEESIFANIVTHHAGTPPRVWGRVSFRSSTGFMGRDTPTCVGKRSCDIRVFIRRWGHPHVCGEEFMGIQSKYEHIGTPPRVWGRAKFDYDLDSNGRDTPTCVGKRQ